MRRSRDSGHSSHIGLPRARAALTTAIYTPLPFAPTAIDPHSGAIGGTLGFIGDLIWLAEWWLAVGHRIAALDLAVSIIAIRFAMGVSSLPAFRDRARARELE